MLPADDRCWNPHSHRRCLDEMRGEFGNIFDSFAKRREMNRKDTEAVVQVLAETTLRDFVRQVPIGGRHNADVHTACPLLADPLELAFLNHAQELALELQRDFANFVEEQRSTVGRLKSSCSIADGSGKCTFDVPEELAFEQLPRDRRAIDDDERSIAPDAPLVNPPRDNLLAGTRRQDRTLAPVGPTSSTCCSTR